MLCASVTDCSCCFAWPCSAAPGPSGHCTLPSAGQAADDEARPADAIVVFGAAEYNGAPSPVLKARLDHAMELDDRGLAPVLITTGGSGGDPHFTEAAWLAIT